MLHIDKNAFFLPSVTYISGSCAGKGHLTSAHPEPRPFLLSYRFFAAIRVNCVTIAILILMTPAELNNQLGVALLAVIGSLIIRKFGISERIQTLVPSLICIAIYWLFQDLPTGSTSLIQGVVSGLLASGLLYIITGLTRRG